MRSVAGPIVSSERRERTGVLWGPLLWLLALGVIGYAAFGPSGWREVQRLRQERLQLESRISELEEENRRLQQRLDRLEHDRVFLEQLAREKLGMVYPDERIVIVP